LLDRLTKILESHNKIYNSKSIILMHKGNATFLIKSHRCILKTWTSNLLIETSRVNSNN